MSNQESILVPRDRIFVLADGTFAVQWEQYRVQELLNGKYRQYDPEFYGNSITDYELNQLKHSGIVEQYNQELVYLSPLPNILPQMPNRAYYLNTSLSRVYYDDVVAVLAELGFANDYATRIRYDFVVIWRKNGAAFQRFDDAERHRELLVNKSPEIFKNTVVSFIEVILIR